MKLRFGPTHTAKQVLAHGTRVEKRYTAEPGQVRVSQKTIGDGRTVPILRVPLSSTGEDRHGDEFSARGLKDLVEQLNAGKVPFFLDHGRAPGDFAPSYNVLDMQGRWTKGEVEDEVCYGTAELDAGDWRSLELIRKVEAGLPVGYSVGFMSREAEPKLDKEGKATGGLTFHATDLFEVSAVGIPSNPDAVQSAITVLARHKGASTQAIRKELGLQGGHDMELTPLELRQIEAQRAAKLDGAPVPQAAAPAPEQKSAPAVDVKAEVRAALKEVLPEALKEAVKATKPKPDDEDEEQKEGDKEDEDEKDDEEKSAPAKPAPKSGKSKTVAPKALVTVKTGSDDEKDAAPDEAREWRPGLFA